MSADETASPVSPFSSAHPTPYPPEPAPPAEEEAPAEETEEEEAPTEAEPVPAATVEVQPLLGLREYRSLANLTMVQQGMLQVWMQQHNHDTWSHYDKAEWDGFLREAKAYIPTV